MLLLGILWGLVTVALIVLLIYKSTLSLHEDDQLFLDDSESHMQKEQTLVLQRLGQLQWPVRILGVASAALLLIIIITWMWPRIFGQGF
jgi:hypothetical protein